MNPKKLIHKSKEKKLELLFSAFGDRLFGFGNGQWKLQKDACWSLVYKTLYKIEEVFEKYDFPSQEQFKGFVFRTFINLMKNHLRDEETRTNGAVDVSLDEEKVASQLITKEEESEEIKVLNELLDSLEDWQRILLLMRAQNYSYADIATYTNKSEKNLKVYYGRLKKQMAKQMEMKLQKVLTDGE